MSHRILIVEDEENQRELYAELFRTRGYQTRTAANCREAGEHFSTERIDLVLTDYRLPDGNGQELLLQIKERNPEVPVILITAYGDMETAVQCLKAGAEDYLAKPVDTDRLLRVVHRLLEKQRLVAEVTQLRRDLESRLGTAADIPGNDPALLEEIGKALRAADTEASVLISGPSGSGKELFADMIHYRSDRREGPYIKLNCSAIPQDLVESELFGHMKGSFTGAHSDRPGRFAAADGGTLFLDEIAELPLPVQAKLLRALQEKEYTPVGSNQSRKANVRFLFATHRNLEEEVAAGRFREDLYWRIHVIALQLPALHERRGDIPLLIRHFIAEFNRQHGRVIRDVSSDARHCLVQHSWPGNVRELKHTIEQTMVLMDADREIIDVHDLPERVRMARGTGLDSAGLMFESLRPRLEQSLVEETSLEIGSLFDQLEKRILQYGLEKCAGNKSRLARLLGVDEKNIRYKLKKYSLESCEK